MKLLFPLHLFYPSKIGGPANTIYWLCKGLVDKGHKVYVVATKAGIDQGLVNLNVWTDVDRISTKYCNTESKFSFSIICNSIRRLKDVDTIVFSSICLIQNVIIAIVAILKCKRIIWSPRGELFDSAVERNHFKMFYFFLIRLLLGKYIIFHATSEEEKKSILKYFPKGEIVIIPNYMEIPEKQELFSNYSSFVFVGRIAPIKALDKLIDGLALSEFFLRSKYHFIFVGGVENQFEGYYQKLLKQVDLLGLSNKIEFVGNLTGKEKYEAFASARYSFLVSESENFGNVVLESLSQGTPVVTSKGTPWNSLIQKKAGFWIDNAPEVIAKTLDYIIQQSEDEFLEYRKNALWYSQEFDIYKHVDEWERVLS